MSGSYRSIWSAEQRKLPKHATPQERGEATRRAAEIYHGGGREVRRNPGGGMLKLALIVGAAVVLGPRLLAPKNPDNRPRSIAG